MLDFARTMRPRTRCDTQVRIVILTGAGDKAFCVGADINEWAALQPLDMWRRWVRRGHQVFDQMGTPAPTCPSWPSTDTPSAAGSNSPSPATSAIASDGAQFRAARGVDRDLPGLVGHARLVHLIGGQSGQVPGV